ncbi:LacI family DNA-binding transcriptional regulator [Ornithinimicrobium cerasi]|uniref:Transcriptional regulator, LacI family n=1 Tax=Ornithinimicrobium cerasi TaxID=2248773 RepID=A0A285VUD1_9MICO|nr:LacI family DNA-binding transcriptional regulator [Ornithinimicrobium cerasi]SOC57654.1 transcriptional regulator, LacI family [Ornithinimicrobium cerasi]
MPPPPRRATIRDVAREAGVSRGTVSRVLNGERYVSDQAREAIERAMKVVGYVPNTAARNLALRRSRAVGFVVHEPHALFLEDPNIGAILLGANTVLSEADHQMVTIVVDSDRDNERVARYLGGGFVDGAVMVSARQRDPMLQALQAMSLPTALVGRPPAGVEVPWVGIDNRGAARAVTEQLVRSGRERVGIIAVGLDRDSGADRLQGFRDALGPSFDEGLVVERPLYEYAAGRDAMQELLVREPALDGVFATSDAVAAGALEALLAAGRSVPGDVSLVGFDDSTWARRCQPALTTVRQPARELGERAAALVLDLLAGKDVTADPAGTLLPTDVVVRDSS